MLRHANEKIFKITCWTSDKSAARNPSSFNKLSTLAGLAEKFHLSEVFFRSRICESLSQIKHLFDSAYEVDKQRNKYI